MADATQATTAYQADTSMSNYTEARKQSLQMREQFNLAGAQTMNMEAGRHHAGKQVIILQG